MEQKKTEFNKVFNAWDILVIAFGAMIGWAGSYPPVAGFRKAEFLEQLSDLFLVES